MLAVSTTEALSILDPATLKNPPESLLSAHPFSEPPTASVWSQDNTALFVAFQDTIHQFSSAGLPVSHTFSTEEPITCLIAKEKGQSLVFGAGSSVHVLDYASGSGKISQTFASHKATVNSLSLSNDGSLLASTSSSSACVQNLSMSSHTILRGLPQAAPITTCAFHPHSRTRLLLGMGKQVVIYDTTRPSGPLKLVALSDASSGDIVALACSPFSKTLVAVATSGGSVGLIDLDKEKGLFRTLNLKMPLTSATFSPEGATLYFGTENGKILIVDLRGLDKPPMCITIGEGGHRIECISFQKKIKASVKPASISKAATSSPARARAKMGVVSASSPARLVRKTATPSAGKAVATPVRATKPAEKKVFSPVRDPLGNGSSAGDISVQMETLGSLRKKDPRKDAENPNGLYGKPRRPSSQLSHSRVTASSGSSGLEVPRVRTRDRAGSSSSRLSSVSRTTSRPASRATSSVSREPSPELPSMQPLSAFSRTTSGQRRARSRTPSPELLAEPVDPATPVPIAKMKKRTGLGVLGLGTPEVERWIEAGKGKAREDDERGNGNGRRVGFKEAEDSEGKESSEDEEPPHLTVQLSPRRAPPPWAQAPMPSPLRTLSAGVSNGNSPSSASAAHNLLRTIMADVMYDYQRDTKSEMMGLHLDLVRMGRNIKKELRESMEGGAGELERLREENRMLREENERLRRGY
ncbi:WD40 repeat-like protein [Athelia psychrophila]|uniref:WD40 repeat-like protein n=1 Tax=Athelia psychrophila TaxID=1759441 RepID=A0A166GJN0_9AGAM|nr:WD40 repeat-like protein [Fibularhizoctonia sp. CBS 109695]